MARCVPSYMIITTEVNGYFLIFLLIIFQVVSIGLLGETSLLTAVMKHLYRHINFLMLDLSFVQLSHGKDLYYFQSQQQYY